MVNDTPVGTPIAENGTPVMVSKFPEPSFVMIVAALAEAVFGVVSPVTAQTIAPCSAVAALSVIRRTLGVVVNVGRVVDVGTLAPALVQVAARAPAAVNVGKPVTEIMEARPAFDPVKLTVTVERAALPTLLNAMDAT